MRPLLRWTMPGRSGWMSGRPKVWTSGASGVSKTGRGVSPAGGAETGTAVSGSPRTKLSATANGTGALGRRRVIVGLGCGTEGLLVHQGFDFVDEPADFERGGAVRFVVRWAEPRCRRLLIGHAVAELGVEDGQTGAGEDIACAGADRGPGVLLRNEDEGLELGSEDARLVYEIDGCRQSPRVEGGRAAGKNHQIGGH